VGNLAYQLQLPENVKVHNVFHVSLLKKYVADPSHVLDDGVIVMPNEGQFDVEPETILAIRERQLRNRTITELLIQWKHYPEEDATWEREEQIDTDYPNFTK
jgi:hypothetical protein